MTFFFNPKHHRTFSVVFLMLALALEPATAYAGFFSAVADLFTPTLELASAATPITSQNMALLAAKQSPDPTSRGGGVSIVDKTALLASTGPIGTDADVAALPPSAEQISVYVVREGDTLEGIGKMFGVSVNTIIWANNIEKSLIKPGQTLVILPVTGVSYTVQKGDTLVSIAKAMKGDAQDIADFNGFDLNKPLAPGLEIVIPDGEKAMVATTPSGGSPKPPSRVRLGIALPDSTYFDWPVPGGVRTQGLHGHNGVDIGAPMGTPIIAAAPGKVIFTRNDNGWNGGYGNYVIILDSNGTQTLYGHMSRVEATVGETVDRGDQIGRVGNTGESTGPHLHFEVRGGTNPFGY
jgi:murein DD-endopeptidase MepM/ murein hydrolase activator NlpD